MRPIANLLHGVEMRSLAATAQHSISVDTLVIGRTILVVGQQNVHVLWFLDRALLGIVDVVQRWKKPVLRKIRLVHQLRSGDYGYLGVILDQWHLGRFGRHRCSQQHDSSEQHGRLYVKPRFIRSNASSKKSCCSEIWARQKTKSARKAKNANTIEKRVSRKKQPTVARPLAT